MKNILKFLTILTPWFLSSILINDTNFYQSLNLPFIAPPKIVFPIVWFILYFLITLSIYNIYNEYKFKDIKEYNKTLLLNYIFNQLFTIVFFNSQNLFLTFTITVIILSSSLFLYYETKKLNDTSAKLLIPYILWNIFATVLSLTIYFMNF